VGCGRVAPQPELVRLAVWEGKVVTDPERRLPGRGAFLCPRPECWERAVARRAFPRAFRRRVEVPAEPLHLSD
jgi:predicted RNA-binding protein YlxR (DUF448 family)